MGEQWQHGEFLLLHFLCFKKEYVGLVLNGAGGLLTANADRARVRNTVFFFSSTKCKLCAYRQGSRRKGTTSSGRG